MTVGLRRGGTARDGHPSGYTAEQPPGTVIHRATPRFGNRPGPMTVTCYTVVWEPPGTDDGHVLLRGLATARDR